MHLFHIDKRDIAGDRAFIRGEEAKHARVVLRLAVGDYFKAFDDEGNVYLMKVAEVTSREVVAKVVVAEGKRPEPAVKVYLGVGIPRGDRFDYILQKATELGVHEVVPFISSRVQVKLPPHKVEGRLQRWRRIVLEAVKQCGNTNIPGVPGLFTFPEAVSYFSSFPLKVIFYEKTFDFTLKTVLAGAGSPDRIGLLVGPEGGFSEEEARRAEEEGFSVAGLGRNILRVETAAVAALSMVQYHFENL